MLPKVSRKDDHLPGAAGGASGAHRHPCRVIPGLQINLKKIMAVYYRVFMHTSEALLLATSMSHTYDTKRFNDSPFRHMSSHSAKGGTGYQ